MDIQAYIQSGIIESYVLGLASDTEIAEVESLARQYPEVQKAIEDFSTALETNAMQNAIAPPPHLKQKIEQAIKQEDKSIPLRRGLSVGDDGTNDTNEIASGTQTKTVHFWKYLAAASVILFLASAAYNFYLYNQFSKNKEQYQALLLDKNSLQASNQVYQTQLKEWQAASSMLADPVFAMIKMPGVKGRENNMATLFWNTKTKDVFVMANNLPAPAKNKQYQLWAIVDGKPVDAGMMDPTCKGACKMKNISTAQAFAITLENAGGSPTPSMEQMMVMGKV